MSLSELSSLPGLIPPLAAAGMSLGNVLGLSLGLVLGAMVFLWVVATLRRDVSLVDPFWGTGFALVAWVARAAAAADDPLSWLIVTLTTLWGVRLSLYLLWRNWGHDEDRRYAAMREHHGDRFWWVSLFTVFLLQGGLMWFISLPIQVALASDQPVRWPLLVPLGLLLWGTGMLFETVGDWQLARFRADPANRGRVLDQGLWRYTRHPNYFGDFCVWWGLFALGCTRGAWWTALSPIAMTWLLRNVSGVALLERTVTDRRPDYAAYQARTSPFFPWPPTRTAAAEARSAPSSDEHSAPPR